MRLKFCGSVYGRARCRLAGLALLAVGCLLSDWPVAQAQAMDATLTRLGREHKLLIVDGDAHQIYLHRQALIDALVEWFRAH